MLTATVMANDSCDINSTVILEKYKSDAMKIKLYVYLIHSRGKTYREVVMLSSDSSHVIQNQVMPLIRGLVKELKHTMTYHVQI